MIIKEEIITNDKRITLNNGAVINRYSHVRAGAEIGRDVMIGQCCYVAPDTMIGDYTRVQNGVSIWDGVTIGKNVFVGPGVCFTNDHDPGERFERDKKGFEFVPDKTYIHDNVTLCAFALIIAPCVVSINSFVAAGTTVLRDVSANERVYGIAK